MLKQTIQKLKNIVSTDDADFSTVLVELFDLIFQKENMRSHREALFLRAVLEYDKWEVPEKKKTYLFTSVVNKVEYTAALSETLTMAYLKKFQNLKYYYSDRATPTMAAKGVFNLIENLNEGKLTLFSLFFISGFFPYEADIWISLEDSVIDGQDDPECEAVKVLLHRAFWALDSQEVLFINYAMNLLDNYLDHPTIRFAILKQVGVYMKYRGMKELQGLAYESNIRTEEHQPPFNWEESVIELKSKTKRPN